MNVSQSKEKHIDIKQNYYKSLDCLAAYNQVSFLGKLKPVYAMDYYGNLQRFSCIKDMKTALSAQYNETTVKGESHNTSKGNVISLASRLEIIKEDGEIELDKSQLKQMTEVFSYGQNVPLYLINPLGEIKRFETSAQAKEAIGVDGLYTHGSRNSKEGCFFIPANDIEVRDENGKIIFNESGKPLVDYQKLDEFIETMPDSKEYPIFLLYRDGHVVFANSIDDACNKKGYKREVLLKSVRTGKPTKNGILVLKAKTYIKRNADNSAFRDEIGCCVADEEKIQKVLNEKFKNNKGFVVKLFDLNTGETLVFNSVTEVAKHLGVSKQAVNYANKYGKTCKGWKVIY